MTVALAPAPTVILPLPEVIDLPGHITGTEAKCPECGEGWELDSLLVVLPSLADVDAELAAVLDEHHAENRRCALAA
ncbi:hypothetical protein Q8791_23085 [Nocardiopsis sp. CT-R113]|uniref:Uncharacterized protein n=1 Tax=Nocardiopsis codii TaxID=3065942 RepID=A0ABU7KCZ4_9ACTN|nr:hypothetical protein [Nocardiopsis sp. CT-R113]MEE2040106.1 hypothetical protein [Nocardiopsis sp. CT-R113]